MALLSNTDALPVLHACGANIQDLESKLTRFIDENTPLVPGKEPADTQPTLGFQRVLQRAIMHVQSQTGRKTVTGANCLVAIFGEKDSPATMYLHQQGISMFSVVNFIAHGITRRSEKETPENMLRAVAAFAEKTGVVKKPSKNPKKNSNNPKTQSLRVFVSYSHLDADCLERLLTHLKPLQRDKLIDCWSDTTLRAGDKWKTKIDENLKSAAVAVLLISADFLASDFIVNNELPPLLMGAEARGIRIIPLILKPCGFHRDKILQSFQAANDPKSPLLGMDEIGQEALYNSVADEIFKEIEARQK